MARDYDSQLLESVAVRRQRLREAVLFGPQRTRMRLDESIGKVVASVCLAAVACAGTVGWSFVSSQLRTQQEAAEQAAAGPPNVTALPLPADWVGEQVTLEMLREELDRAQVPPDLYVLPDEPRPEADGAASYYLLTTSDTGYSVDYSVSVIEFQQGRTGPEFVTEDEAARWLYQELALVETEPERLTAEEEQAAAEQNAELAGAATERLEGGAGDSYKLTLETGQIVDAFGQESGSLLFPDGTPFERRGLPEFAREAPAAAEEGQPRPQVYHRYRVTYPFQVTAALSPAAERSPGGGVRFAVDSGGFTQQVPLPSIRWLLGNGYLERVAVTSVPE
ncbi:TNT domain-containing protein [Actinorugispora endophytica]|uniref:Uncharacterized protein DUF4237 n=1 Tax=Actinorugispora endophytica TaxID=1605990 RepID=A0A4R6V2F5_9ACTN|nr:TNT domain-containing protein [Actinorugispora endophytica]TDQ52264.1 uncharacterized protein DUF4237 [Actinorugispora endophytica]